MVGWGVGLCRYGWLTSIYLRTRAGELHVIVRASSAVEDEERACNLVCVWCVYCVGDGQAVRGVRDKF